MAAKVESLQVRKLADQTVERVKMFDPFTGEVILLEPDEAAALRSKLAPVMADVTPSPRPFLGLRIEGRTPKRTRVGSSFVAKGISEGWIEGEGEALVVRTAGPRENPFGPRPHAFRHFTYLTFKTVDGDVRYEVVENPDKWPAEKDGEAGFGGEVRDVYLLQRVKG